MKTYFSERLPRLKNYVIAHKILASTTIIAVLLVGYWGVKKVHGSTNEVRYIVTTVKKGTVVSTVSASGQVSATNKVDVKAKVSGNITWVGATVGQRVYAGQGLASIDNKNAKAALADAQASLAQAKLQFQKDQATAPINYQKSVDDVTNAKNDLDTEYNDTFNNLSNTYLDIPPVVTSMQNILYGYDLSPTSSQWNLDVLKNMFSSKDEAQKILNFANIAESDYKTARTKYDAALLVYKQMSRFSDPTQMEDLLAKSIDMLTAVAQTLQSESNFLSSITDTASLYNVRLSSTISTMQTNTRSNISTTNNSLSTLLSQKKSLETSKQTIKTGEQNLELLKIGDSSGNNPISLQISENNIEKQERNLQDLQTALYDYTVVAPFDGTVAAVTAKVGDTSGTIATIITDGQVAELSLNEVDASKVSLKQKAILTFDAIDDLSMTGTISEIDPVGTVSQGVVSYTIKITFDTQDPRIKPGMTVNAAIQTAVHSDVLVVPSSAVKTSRGTSYVQVFTPPLVDTGGTAGTISGTPPEQVEVTTGISDGTTIEIQSGLEENEQIVSRTITATTVAKTTSTTPSATSLLGGGAGGRTGNVNFAR
ncbi:MAG: HlyD family efflux transporter periplasmic adaptor subunit [Patescibacteria group bacterium]